jgi:hypothetical protein
MMNRKQSATAAAAQSASASFNDEPEFPSVYQIRAGRRLPNGSWERLVYLVDRVLPEWNQPTYYDKFVGVAEDQSGVREIIEQHRATLRQAEFLHGPAF